MRGRTPVLTLRSGFAFALALYWLCSPAMAGGSGSCCVDGACIDGITQADCSNQCGMWNGAGTTCAGELCPLPFGQVCCLPDGSCDAGLLTAGCPCAGGTLILSQSCGGGCNNNGVPDQCDIISGTSADCNENGIPDECDIADGTSTDCDGDGVPDECQFNDDCAFDITIDCNFDGVLDACEPDCDGNMSSDICDLILFNFDCAGPGGLTGDFLFGQITHQNNCQACHGVGGQNGTAPPHRNYSRYRYQQKTSGCVGHNGGPFLNLTLQDFANLQAYLSDFGPDGNGIPDGCEALPDCDMDGVPDSCVLSGTDPSTDCNSSGIPDECDIADGTEPDCNSNGIPDACDASADCNSNGIPDECDIADGTSADCTANGVPDECEPDCNNDMTADSCDIDAGTSIDCDANGIPDECEPDCNNNMVVDACDISGGTSDDLNANGIPDECEPDCNNNGIPDDLDVQSGDVGKQVQVDYAGFGPAIPDCDPPSAAALEDTLVVDFGGNCDTVEVLRVSLDVLHSWPGDVVVELQSPQGTVVTLLSRAGLQESDPLCSGAECCGVGDDDIAVELDDSYATSIETAATLTGSFHPDSGATGNPGSLSAFAGENECGTWTLRISDGSPFDSGSLEGWGLDFRLNAVDLDCNRNQVPDTCDLTDGNSGDCNANSIPDDCEDCNGNTIADECDLTAGTSQDCNNNSTLDECEPFRDCNGNGTLDDCDIDTASSFDCDLNGAPDECDLAGTSGLFFGSILVPNVLEHDAVTFNTLKNYIPADIGMFNAWAVEFTDTGTLLATDTGNRAVFEFDGDNGAFLGEKVAPAAGNLQTPVDLLFRDNGNLLVLDQIGGVVRQYDATFGSPMPVFAQLTTPGNAFDMVLNANGDLLLTDFAGGQIEAFSGVDGTPLGAYTTGGGLVNPIAMAVDGNGDLWVGDLGTDTIQHFDPAGVFIEDFAGLGSGAQFFAGKMAFGPDGWLYLTHGALNLVARINPTNVAEVETLSTLPDLGFPMGLAFRPPSNDCNTNVVPDECEDCNNNYLADFCDIDSGYSEDLNANTIPDECEGADVSFQLVVRTQDDGADSATELPLSVASVETNTTFFIELWGTDSGPLNTGLEQVYVEMTFDPNVMFVENVTSRPPFTFNTFNIIDNEDGTVSSMGGRDAGLSGVGIEPEWRRIAVVQALALQCDASALTVDIDLPGIMAVGRGLISNLGFTGTSVQVSADCVYNLAQDDSGLINSADLGILAGCWLSSQGEINYDPDCDFNCDGTVDAADLGWFAVGWLKTCGELTEADVPECRACIDGPEGPTPDLPAAPRRERDRKAQPAARPARADYETLWMSLPLELRAALPPPHKTNN